MMCHEALGLVVEANTAPGRQTGLPRATGRGGSPGMAVRPGMGYGLGQAGGSAPATVAGVPGGIRPGCASGFPTKSASIDGSRPDMVCARLPARAPPAGRCS